MADSNDGDALAAMFQISDPVRAAVERFVHIPADTPRY
jgi:hypothetical protein